MSATAFRYRASRRGKWRFALVVVSGALLSLSASHAEVLKALAEVGGVQVWQHAVSQRQRVDACYSGAESSRTVALIELINMSLERCVLEKAFGMRPPEAVLRTTAQQVRTESRAPEILSCVQDVYRDAEEGYLWWYIAPTLVNPKLHESFSQDANIQKEARETIESVWSQVKRNRAKLSKMPGYRVTTVSDRKIDLPGELRGIADTENSLIKNVLSKLKAGEMWPEIIETSFDFQLVRLISSSRGKYTFGTVVVPKRDFTEWFREYVEKYVEIRVFDLGLKQELKEKYASVFWVNLIRK